MNLVPIIFEDLEMEYHEYLFGLYPLYRKQFYKIVESANASGEY